MASVAERLRPLVRGLLGADPPLAIRCWDGSTLGSASDTSIILRSPDALRRLLFAPNELGLGRAYVAGDIDVDGDIFKVLELRDMLGDRHADVTLHLDLKQRARALQAARRLGALGRPLPPPPEEARLEGRLHSKTRDAAAIRHHYDVSNDFYRLVLGQTMTYSCAYYANEGHSLDDAQAAKYDLICRKLALRPGMHLLDVGCGWGGMVLHAAEHYGVDAVGVTLSKPQADLAEKRVAEAGLTHRIKIKLQDYRDISDGPFDAISSIGMFEHVGLSQLHRYFGDLYAKLRPGGRLLNHAISRPPGPPGFDKTSFIARYVFPDGELHEVGTVVSAMQEHHFEVRDVESLREHYARTLRAWVRNLESYWDEAQRLVGRGRARVWRLYMAASAVNFEAGRTNIHQVLGVRADASGHSHFPSTRRPFIS